jgi:UDP-4-amino-4,6-dideoxy-N-acetyl-beta-L-altrosamine transaminase
MKLIPYGRQEITEEDIAAVVQVLRSDFLTQGPKIEEFETAFASYVGSKYAIAVANGTAALHLSILGLGVRPGDKVIVPSITFSASANCVRYCGGDVVFADIHPGSWLLDVQKVEELLINTPPNTFKGIVAVDFAGQPVNLEKLRKVADKYGLWILEDACHAPGGYFIDSNEVIQKCGNCAYADLAIFSFHPVKHIATGEGGMITTNDENLLRTLRLLRTHGITRNTADFKNDLTWAAADSKAEKYPGWYMEMQELGYNYRLTDFQSALGISQLRKADERLKRRREIAAKYDDSFRGVKQISIQATVGEPLSHAYHLYVILADNRMGLYDYLRSKGILCQVHYVPVHRMPYYAGLGWKNGDLPISENYYSKCLSLPMYPTLTADDQDFVCSAVKSFYS